MAKPTHYQRYNSDLSVDALGRLFFDNKRFIDLSSLNILRTGVDTVRQLYKGFIRPEVFALFENPGITTFAGHQWHVGRIGRDSGYQYKLQNADLGLVLLIKNFNIKPDSHGPHLKIEVSPHLIDDNCPQALQCLLDDLASYVLESVEHAQCAIHLATDIQGWEPPQDLVASLHCRSRLVRQFDTIESIDFDSLAVTYGRGETFMFGSPSGVQLCIYNKTKQAKATDKLDYWESVWRQFDDPFENLPTNYNPDMPVWRIEFRFHHSVIQQFSEGSVLNGEPCAFRNYLDLSPHLDGLLRYGYEGFKYLNNPSHYHPVWTLLMHDSKVLVPVDSFLDKTEYRRYYKTSNGFSGKNIELLLGNAISLAARENLSPKQLYNALQTLPFWSVIQAHYVAKGMTAKGELYGHIKDLLHERRVRWGKAV